MSLVSLCLLIASQAGRVHLAPVGGDAEPITSQPSGTMMTEPSSTGTISVGTESSLIHDDGNFITSEEQFQEFLRRSQAEFEESIKLNPQNYASEDMSIEQIMAMFDEVNRKGTVRDEKICPICKDDLEAEPSIETHCGHKFHTDCLSNYLRFVSIGTTDH